LPVHKKPAHNIAVKLPAWVFSAYQLTGPRLPPGFPAGQLIFIRTAR